MSNYVHIGKIVASFGLKGELIIKHSLGAKPKLNAIEAVFIELHKNSFLPYFIEDISVKSSDEISIKLESINTKEDARTLLRKNIWLTNEDFRKVAHTSSPVLLLGYKVINDGDDLGIVEEVIEQPHQILLKLLLNNKETYIPLHDETLNKIDKKKQEIYVTLPEGLLDIYK